MTLLSRISLLLSVIGIIIGISMHYDLYVGYQAVTGKTGALYGLRQWEYLEYGFIGLAALLFALITIFKKEHRKTILLTLSLSLLAILIFVFDLWRIFI